MKISADVKTTIIGIGGAIASGGGALLTAGNLNWRDYVTMAFMTLIGFFSNKKNKN